MRKADAREIEARYGYSRIGSGIVMAKLNGHNVMVAGGKGNGWYANVDGTNHGPYDTKCLAMIVGADKAGALQD